MVVPKKLLWSFSVLCIAVVKLYVIKLTADRKGVLMLVVAEVKQVEGDSLSNQDAV